MKSINILPLFIAILAIAFTSCEKDELSSGNKSTEGFSLKSNGETIIGPEDIEYYDYSAHLIYLKNHKSFANDIKDIVDFSVYADGVEIYTGHTQSGYSSSMHLGAVIPIQPSFYPDFIIPIGFNKIIDSLGNSTPDPREDDRIADALKEWNQFHAGLSCELSSVNYSSPNKVVVKLNLRNNDSFNYYYLDPEKMGINLFHYYTNGLHLWDSNKSRYLTHKISVDRPVYNLWDLDWLSVIKGNETVKIKLTYDKFESVSSGEYRAFFRFPGFHSNVSKDEIQQSNGKIWLGEIEAVKIITID